MSPALRASLFWTSLVAVVSLGGCGGMEIESIWSDQTVTVDGAPIEWAGAMVWVEDPNVAIGAKNDDDYLYLCLSSPDRRIVAQIVMRGFTVWLDPEGKKGKTFGIRCPVGDTMGAGFPGKPDETAKDRDNFMDVVVKTLEGAGSTLEILRSDEGTGVRLSAGEAAGIDVALGHHDGRLVYELRVPFRQDDAHPYAIGSDGTGRIGVGFETPEIDRDEMMAEMGDRMPGGGMRGGPPGGGPPGGGPPGGGPPGGGPPGGAGEGMPERINIWGKINLAAAVSPEKDVSISGE